MSNHLKKITARAKQIRKAHPSMKWTSAIKKASAELKAKGEIGGARAVARRTARRTVRRVTRRKKKVGAAPVKRVGVVRRKKSRVKGVSKVSAVGRASESQLKGAVIGKLYDKLGELTVRRERNTKRGPHVKLTKQITEVKRQIRLYK